MKQRYWIGALVILILVALGYIVGQFIPFAYLRPNIVENTISINDLYTRGISIFGAFATIFATLIALFKEDIRKLIEYASLEMDFKNTSEILSENTEAEQSDDSAEENTNLTATKYEVIAVVCNKGNLPAKSCQIYLEQLNYKNDASLSTIDIQPAKEPLLWIGKSESTALIPSTAKVYVPILEILSPNYYGTIEQPDFEPKPTDRKPRIKIAGMDIDYQNLSTTYECTFKIYSENAKPVEFIITITWNGKWAQRLTEMKKFITIKKSNTENKNA